MKVVALVSGGKDSCFNILHCLAQGHQIVALANLLPADATVQELDSFMFQTVGHDALTYYSECCDLPMYRGKIHGGSTNQSLEYTKTKDDEIEDLFFLLEDVKKQHPGLEGVSVGAILSSYQRTRVEDVCLRLGLTSLAFLWQRNQLELMQEMVSSSMDARLIKVAAIGLNETHLGKSLKEMFPTMINLDQRFGVHICGEGGEFESLVLDAPFFVKRIEIVKSETVISGNDVCYLKPTEFRVVDKTKKDEEFYNINDRSARWSDLIPTAKILTNPFEEIYDILKVNTIKPSILPSITADFCRIPSQSVKRLGNKLFISNLTSSSETVEEQVQHVFNQLHDVLESNSINTAHIQHSTLLLSSMVNFQEINSLYVKNFTQPLPPSRVCIETSLPNHVFLQLSVVALLNVKGKSGVHIQGRSHWAPANIGPYSQAIMDESNTASISGQIPLIPATMQLSTEGVIYDIVLSLQHFNSVKDIIGGTNQLSVVSFIKDSSIASMVAVAWENYCILEFGENPLNSLIIVQVSGLPKGASVEWGGLCFKKITSLYDDDETDDETDEEIELEKQFRELTVVGNNNERVQNLALTSDEFKALQFNSDSHYTIYGKPENIPSSEDTFSIDYIPVSNIWNFEGKLKDFGVIVRSL